MKKIIYPLLWSKDEFSIKIFCSIPNIATGILLKTENNYSVIDPGDGILRDLTKELNVQQIIKIQNVFITHGHHDHIGGLWSLLTYLKAMNKKSYIKIHYPEGGAEIEHIYEAFIKVYKNQLPYKIILNSINGNKPIKYKNLTVKPFTVIHTELVNNKKVQVPSVGFNFHFNNLKICYGGDTAYCETLVQNATDADLAIIEAGRGNYQSDDMHMSIKQATKVGKLAKDFFLVHVPQ